ncbi:MAG: hypothetical protein ABIN95_11210 [Mucilaginibacter sp.]
MTTVIIELPDSATSAISALVKKAKAAGGLVHIESDDDLCADEFELLKESYKEALSIKDGTQKVIPASELWND